MLAYERRVSGATVFAVVLNMRRSQLAVELPGCSGRVALSTYLDRDGERVEGRLSLQANEGVIIQVAG